MPSRARCIRCALPEPRPLDSQAALALLKEHAPEGHTVRSATSALAKLLAYQYESPLLPTERLAHQADFIASALTGGPCRRRRRPLPPLLACSTARAETTHNVPSVALCAQLTRPRLIGIMRSSWAMTCKHFSTPSG